jgi:hypothetical protein
MSVGDRLWVSRFIDSGFSFSNDFVNSFVKMGWMPVLAYVLWFVVMGSETSLSFQGSFALAVVLLSVAPYLIYRWENTVFPEFFGKVSEIVEDQEALERIRVKYFDFYSSKYVLTIVPWTALFAFILFSATGFLESQGIQGYTDPGFMIYLFFILWTGVFTGLGAHLILTTIFCIRAVSEIDFSIYHLHPDGLGGLSSIGYFAIWTTLLSSLGSLALPLAFHFAARSGMSLLIYALVFIYIGLIAASFFYPTVKVNRRAQELREEELRDHQDRINELERKFNQDDLSAEEADLIKTRLDEAREEYRERQNVKLYPLTPKIITKLLGSIILPVAFLLLEIFLTSSI